MRPGRKRRAAIIRADSFQLLESRTLRPSPKKAPSEK